MESPNLYAEPRIKQFVEIAANYCLWAESFSSNFTEQMLIARKLLAGLHLAVLDLPDLGCGKDVIDIPSLSKENHVYHHFKNMPINGYWDVFDPLNQEDTQSVFNSLADDLSDIYKDLKRGISRLALKFIVMTRQGAGGREQGEKGFEPCLLFFTQFDFIAPTYLLLYNQGYITEAVWEWRFHFEIHWGVHLVGAQRAIHSYFS
ncbi:hypothetical protein NIES4075_09310 [Tolypothrix sp. NIES-4075]|uniref:DUF5063 domain-containing protein n=1 Tax=Tolypothrix sp. NIES-4075 TaxID=2005459 RepID=UPI000B5C5B50|nr:DUF5063 domain-containing protein [Tolypothrix sp. NIES-4075]GAX39969.1 hypothetical protein NIES4075_09310 [Tolypothrix sp. NIES-4075]